VVVSLTAEPSLSELGIVREARGWVRIGRLPGPRMWSLAFMRVERLPWGRWQWRWRAWDCVKLPGGGHPHATKIHKSLRAAKEYCEGIVNGAMP
jgi:hypothetical protein